MRRKLAVDAQPGEPARDALAARHDELRCARGVRGDDFDMLGAFEQRRGVADRAPGGRAAVPGRDDPFETRRLALYAGHDDDGAPAFGDDRAGQVVQVRRLSRLDLLDDDESEAAGELRHVSGLGIVRVVKIQDFGLHAGRLGARAEILEHLPGPRVPRLIVAAGVFERASSDPSVIRDASRRGRATVTRDSNRRASART